jgi:hypothetical protein
MNRDEYDMSPEEYAAQKRWLLENPHGFRAREVERKLRRVERELRAQGIDIKAWARPVSTPWLVAQQHGRRTGQVRHLDRHCMHLDGLPDHDVRPATQAEVDDLPPCMTCG